MATFEDVTCTGCGCICDDLRVTVESGKIVCAEGACSLVEPLFLSQSDAQLPETLVDGQPVVFDRAIARAASILSAARAPLIYGLSGSSTDGQRAAVRLADQIGATIDTTASQCHAPSIMAIQQVGESVCSLGEAKNRCDLVIFWGCDPATSHPRHGERYSLDPVGQFLPGGRSDRQVVVIDVERTESADGADWFIPIEPGHDFEAIWTLRSLLRDQTVTSENTGLPLAQLRQLAEQMRSCRSGIVYFGLGLARQKEERSGSCPPDAHLENTGHATVEALLRLVTDLNAHTRFYARRMRIPGNVVGADSVLCWQTGFPFAVNLSRGYPRYSPGEYTADDMLRRNEADACLLVGSEGLENLSPAAMDYLRQIPTIVLDHPEADCPIVPSVQFTTAIYGIHAAGTAYRMDEVPIPLKAVLPSQLPTDDRVLRAIASRLED